MPLRNSNTIQHLVLLKNTANLDRLLEETLPELHLLSHTAAVDLDFHQVRLLLLQRRLADLGVREHAHDGAVLLDALELTGYGGAGVLGVLLGVFGEGLLLGFVPVLVEAAFYFVRKMLGPDSGEGA